ncbi:MAG: DUF4239 domain-containing protein [Pirellulaceae bacterium]|nr:DUF4239 domain-containing protein [Pirellulaceae bacterium]
MILPLWLLGTLLVGGTTLATVAALWWVRRLVPPERLRAHHDVGGFILGVIGAIYAILLAFVVLVVWERYGEAEIIAEREANALIDIYRLAPGLPEPIKVKIRAGARDYAKRVIAAEWPAMNRGAIDDGTTHALDQLWRDSMGVKAEDSRETAIFGHLLDRLIDVSDNRQLRLLASRTGIQGTMWLVLAIGGVATLVFTFYFGVERFAVQAGMTALLATLISLVLFLISALNFPFTGDLKVESEAMQTTLVRFDIIEKHEASEH